MTTRMICAGILAGLAFSGSVAVGADVTRPTVAVSAPVKAQALLGGTNAQFTVKGTAADSGGLAAVMWQLNGGPFAPAQSTNSWKSWSAPATLAVGTNALSVYSVDLSGNVSVTQRVAFTYRDVGVPLAEFAKAPANKALGYKAVAGVWYDLDALAGLYCVSPAKGATAALQVSVAGPGILSFSWELAGGDGTNALTCAVGTKLLATNKVAGAALPCSVAVPMGAQTVKWTLTRGKLSGETRGILRDVRWTPLGKADTPLPGNGQVLMRRTLAGLSWNAAGDYCRVYAGLAATAAALTPVGAGAYDGGTVPLGDIDALVGLAAGKTIYWRADSVQRDSDGHESVNTGTVWSFTALPEGSPEFETQSASARLTVGVAYELGPYAVLNGATGTLSCAVKAGALPAGMSAVARGGAVYLTGVPSKPGSFPSVLQVSRKLGTVTAPGTTLSLSLEVDALPAWAWGTFDGYTVHDALGCGAVSMSVTALGKITGKIAIAGSNFIISAGAYLPGAEEGELRVATVAKAGLAAQPLTLSVRPPASAAGGFAGSGEVVLYRNAWKDAGRAAALTNYTGYYTATLPGGVECGSGYLAFTADKLGGVKTAGKLADGTAVALSGVLIADATGRVFTVLYTAPAAYKGGSFFGLAEFVTPAAGGRMCVRPLSVIETPLLWSSLNPAATAEYGAGFWREMELSGGRYDTLVNLRAYYEAGLTVDGVEALPALLASVKITDYDPESEADNPPKISWLEESVEDAAPVDPNGLTLGVTPATGVGTGLVAPKAGVPVKLTDPDTGEYLGYNYDDLVNPTGLTIAFTRATGIFKGTFNVYYDYLSADDYTTDRQTWTHVVKKASYEGVLTPVREEGGAEGSGFFLWADKGWYETGKFDSQGEPLLASYAFNGSYDFLLSLP